MNSANKRHPLDTNMTIKMLAIFLIRTRCHITSVAQEKLCFCSTLRNDLNA